MSIASRIEWAFGADLTANPATWTWTDTSLFAVDSVSVTGGRWDEAFTTQPASCTFRLGNTDSRFTPRHPASPYYPNVRRQTPVRVSLNPGTGYVQRFQGYVDEIAPLWPAGNSQYAEVLVTASGSLRRLGQGGKPLRSTMYRVITATTGARAYWSGEDSGGSIVEAFGGAPMQIFGSLQFAAAGPVASSPLLSLSATTVLTGFVSSHVSSGAWSVECVVYIPSTPPGAVTLMSWSESGTFTSWRITLTPGSPGTLTLTGSNSGGSTTVSMNFLDSFGVAPYDQWLVLYGTAAQSGGNIDYALRFFTTTSILGASNLVAGTVGAVAQVVFADANLDGVGLGHVSVWDTALAAGALFDAFTGYVDELATTRLTRLCTEQGVALALTGASDVPMGAQTVATFMSLVRECEAADGGILYDGAGAGLSYLSRQSRYNLPVSLALDTQRQQVKLPFAPTEDDQRVRNDWTVFRSRGSSGQARDLAHIAANGLYDTSTTINVADDTVLPGQAAWRVHLTTAEEMRVPGLSLQLIDHPELWASWLATTLGERVTAANLPTQYPPGILDMVMEGYTETWDAVSWRVDLNTSPFQPWLVDALNTTFRLEMAGQTLAANLAPGATSLSLATAAGHALFTTTATFPADFPMDIKVAGWQIRVTAATGAASPQTLTVALSPNTATIPSGTAVTLWRPAALAL